MVNTTTENYKFFQHKDCEFFPCTRLINRRISTACSAIVLCMRSATNAWNFQYTDTGFKDCTNCMFPHVRSNYEKILERYQDIIAVAARNSEKKINCLHFPSSKVY